jgi:hypothetical protein
VRTDDRGQFRVHSLPAAEYYLEAAADPLDVLTRAPVPGQPVTMIGRAFYPGVPRIEGGRLISLGTGQDIGGLEFTMPIVPATRLQGTVQDSTGAPAKPMFVRVQRVGGLVGEVRGSSDPAGNRFNYPSVPAGEFWLMGTARQSPTADQEFAVTRVTTNGEPNLEVVLTTAKGALVTGHVEVEGDQPPLLTSLQVVAHETEFEFPALPGATDNPSLGTVAADGTFAFKSLFGPRLLRFQKLPAGWTLKSVHLDGEDVSDRMVTGHMFRYPCRPTTKRLRFAS